MRIVWTPSAADDLEQINDYLFERNPMIAAVVVRKIYSAPDILKRFPNRGRPGRKDGTRELVLSPLPYIIIYEIAPQLVVRLLRIVHGSQKWPEQ
jgi:toxin ParE1/3/4